MDIRPGESPSVGVADLEDPVSMAAQFMQKLEPLFTVKAAQVGSSPSVVDRLTDRASTPIAQCWVLPQSTVGGISITL